MFEEYELIQEVRNADPMIMNELLRVFCQRFEEVNPEYSLLVVSVDKKRDFLEQADEYIALMQSMKDVEIRQRNKESPK